MLGQEYGQCKLSQRNKGGEERKVAKKEKRNFADNNNKNCNHKPAGKPGYLFTLRMRHNLVGKRSADRDQTNPRMPRLSTVLTKNRHQPMFTGGAPKGGVGGCGSGERIQTLVILGLMDDLARRFFGA